MGALRAGQRRRQVGLRVRVGQMQADGRGLVQHQIAIDEHRDQPVRVQPQVLGSLVRSLRAVDERQFEGRADLAQQHMRCEAGVAGVVMQLDHGRAVAPRAGARMLS
jgi:hypothetical protein